MRPLPPGADDALAPLRAAIDDRAKEAALAAESEARQRCQSMLADAKREASATSHRATEAGTKAALADAAQRSARERRRAHELRLAGRESLRQALTERVLAHAAKLRDEPEYPQVLESLTEEARAVLGTAARVEESPDGGVVASLGARHLDLSLPSLARATLDAMRGEVAELWRE